MIEAYRFGSMQVDGRRYTSDLIIGPEKIQADWWRKSGHCLCMEDLEAPLQWGIERLVIGTGARGMMSVPDKLPAHLEARGIVAEARRTGEARMRFNELLREGQRVAGAFHLTC